MRTPLFARIAAAILLLLPTAIEARIPPKRNGVWAQNYVDRFPDPAARIGTLPNGLRYIIQRNTTPAGQMAMRFVIDSGSLAEQPGSEGIAHFLEHMAFRGSTHIPDGEMMRILQRKGLALGADTNAGTSPPATVYQFDFPQGGKDNLDQGLMLFREIGSELLLDQKSVDAERGAVLSEERLRDGPQLHAVKAMLGFTLQGQLAPDRLPIGKVDVIQHADAALIRKFYEGHYRPNNAAIVVVGDVDPVEAEAAIKARFADWQPKGPAAQTPSLGSVARRGEQARLFSEPGAPTNSQIVWVRPFDDRADTMERTKEDLNRLAGMLILNQRLSDISRRADAPFIVAGFSQNNLLDSANVTNLSIGSTTDRQLSAMRAAIDEQRRVLRYGITQPELDRALSSLNAALSGAVSGASTRPSNQIANAMVKDIIDNEVTRSPEQNYTDFRNWLRFVKLKDVDQAVKAAFEGSGPLLFVASPQPPAGGEQAIATAFDEANRDKLAAVSSAPLPGWPYTAFGVPGKVVDRKDTPDLGLTSVTFDNGIKLIVKPTAFAKGEILTSVGFGQGRLGLPANRAYAYWMLAGGQAMIDGGTGKVTAGDIQKIMAGHVVGLRFELLDNAFQLAGATRPEDLPVQLQIITAYLSDPGFRPEAVTRQQNVLATLLPQLDSTPNTVLARSGGPMLHGGDMRWTTFPTTEQLAQSKPQDLILLLEPAMSGPITVTMVGDVTVDKAIEAVGKTLGALPARAIRIAPNSAGVSFPAPNAKPIELTHNGRADQAIALAAWRAPGFYDAPQDARALQVLAAVIKQRLFDTIREREGTTYSPDVNAANSTTIDHYGFLLVSVEMPPAKIAGFYKALDLVLADLKAKPLTADELDRARKPIIEARARDKLANGYWIQTLAAAQFDPRELDAIRTRVSGVEAVTAADLQRVATAYLGTDRAFRAMVVPKGVPALTVPVAASPAK